MLDGRGSFSSQTWVHVAVALLCWVVVLLRRPDDETTRAGRRLWAGLLTLAVGATCDAWPVKPWLDGLNPDRAVSGAFYGASTMLGAGMGAVAIVEWAAPDWLTLRARRTVDVLLGLMVVSEIVALLSLPRSVTELDVPDHRLAEQLAVHPQAYVSLLLTVPMITLGILTTSRCCLWYRGLAPDGPSARALQRIVVANAFLAGWLVLRLVALLLVIGGSRVDVGPLIYTSDVSFEVAILGYLAAFLSVRGTLGRARSRVAERRALRRMRPLWSRTVAVHPEVVLRPDGWWRDAVDPRDLTLRRYRRVIEFRDAVLLLLPHLDGQRRAAVRDWLQPRVPADDLDLVADAVELELARHDALAGVPGAVFEPDDLLAFGPLLRGGADVDAEVGVLVRVAAREHLVERAVQDFITSAGRGGGAVAAVAG